MNVGIETLEGRTLFTASTASVLNAGLIDRATASTDPAVQATLALVQADGTAIAAARDLIQSESADSRPALRDIVRNGNALLAADRQAARDVRDDPTALAAARDKLKADRQQLRADIATARDQLHSDTTDGRAALKDALSSLRDHLRQLRTDLRNATAGTPSPTPTRTPTPTPTMPIPVTSNAAGRSSISSTDDASRQDVQNVIDRVEQVIDNATPADHDAVETLVANFVSAIQDHSISPDEREQLRDNVRTVLSSANVSPDELRSIADEVGRIIRDGNLSRDDIRVAANELRDIYLASFHS